MIKDSGGIDILINNAGLFLKSSLEEIDEELIRRIFNINVFAPIILTKLFSRNMKKRSGVEFLILDLHLHIMAEN